MDFTNNLDTRKYVMSLDSIDLALLPDAYTPGPERGTKLLWNANKLKLNPNEYYKFEVKPKSDSEILNGNVTSLNTDDPCYHQQLNQSISSSLPREDVVTITCHICDIELPAAYLDEHENSLKHKANLKITEVVLDRTRKHMMKKAVVHKKNDTKYFCGPCASEIEIVCKQSHEKSKGHKQSVSLDRLLYELVALYANEENEPEEEPRSVTNNETLNENANEINDKNLNTEVERNNNNTILVSDIKARLDEFEIKTMENYIKMINECDTEKSYIMSSENNELRISVPEDYEVIVSMDNFNGFMRIDKNLILCIVCKMIVENENDHKISDTHIKNIVAPFDRQCLRNLDNSSSHCVICNKIFTNADFHVLFDETHNKFLQRALVPKEYNPSERLQKALMVKENKLDKPTEDSKDCNGCVNDDYQNEMNKTKPKSNESKPDIVEMNEHRESDSKNCNGSGNDSDSLNEIDKTKPKPNERKPDIVVINNETRYCRICNLEMHVNNVSSHIKGTKHALNSKSNIHYLMKPIVGSADLDCRVCNTYVSDNSDNIAEHLSTAEHDNKYKELLSTNFVIQHKEEFYCKPCDISFLKMNELYHIQKVSHVVKLAYYNESISENHKNKKNTKINGNVINDSKYLNKTMAENQNTDNENTNENESIGNISPNLTDTMPEVDTDNEETKINDSVGNNLACFKKTTTEVHKVIQNTNINESVDNISTDLEETMPEVHTDNAESKINDSIDNSPACLNKTITEVKKVSPVNSHYCKICNVYIPNNSLNIIGHNNGGKHRKKVLAAIVEMAEMIESKYSNSESLDVYHYHMNATDNEKNLMCKVCHVIVPNREDGVTEHITGKKHDTYFKIILNENYIETVGDLYFCNYCKVHMQKQNIFKHINETGHKKRMKLDTEIAETEIAEMEIDETEIAETEIAEMEIAERVEASNSQHTAVIKKEEQKIDTLNNNKSIDNLYLKFKHHFREATDKDWLYCLICTDTNVLNTVEQVAGHVSGQTHLNGYKDLIYNNFIFETEEQLYFCAICVCLVPLKGEVHHARGLRHTKNYANTTKEQKCNFCDVDISSKVMYDHMNSNQHLKRVMKEQTLLHFCEFCKTLMQTSKAEEHLKSCHKFSVKDEICFCTSCDPYLPGTH